MLFLHYRDLQVVQFRQPGIRGKMQISLGNGCLPRARPILGPRSNPLSSLYSLESLGVLLPALSEILTLKLPPLNKKSCFLQ